ncbi:hypothetical protein GCM10009616_24540 [Microlunatus lacustris]
MTVQTVRRRAPVPHAAHRPHVPPQVPQRVLADQQAFVADVADVLRRAGTSGQRLTTALFLILAEHGATPAGDGTESLHLRCRRCRSEDLEPAAQYPCTTAQQAYWALDAVLS